MQFIMKFVLFCVIGVACARDPTPQEKIVKELFTDYDSQVSPHDASKQKITVNMTFQVTAVQEIEDSHGDMQIRGFMYMDWNDQRLAFKDSNPANIKDIRVNPANIWIPDLSLFNWAGSVDSLDIFKDTKDAFPAMVMPDGKVFWVPQVVVVVTCDRSNFRNALTCPVKIGSWTYSVDQMDLVDSQTKFGAFFKSNVWTLTNEVVKQEKQKYPCCPEDYGHLLFEFSFEKKPKQEHAIKK